MTTKRRCRPTTEPAPTTTHNVDDAEFTRLLGLQRHEPLTAETRAEIDLLIKAAEMGFRLSVRCVDCGHWITAPRSVRAHRGPVCAAKAVRK